MRLLSGLLEKRASQSAFAMKAIVAGGSLGLGCAGLGLVIILRGLQQRRRTRRELLQSLDEKDILLKEVHHRVKNNLQVISSLLNLESSKLQDPVAVTVFRECRDRIHSIGRLHQQIYSRGEFAHIDFGEHLRELAEMLFRSHRPHDCEVTLDIRCDPVTVDLDTAVTLCLIANEAILNSLKHAFTGRQSGRLSLTLHAGERCEMSVADDGIGLPDGFDARKCGGLGTELLMGLSRQLRGEATMKNLPGGGACTTVLFPNSATQQPQQKVA
jgi:two-component sensor histidine kinase